MSARFLKAIGIALIASTAFAIEQPKLPEDHTRVRELRVGVVCYGGISLSDEGERRSEESDGV